MEDQQQPLRCVEFFSGIGGMHYALQRASDVRCQMLAAFDINAIANAVYQHNFGFAPTVTCVEHLPLTHYEKLRADLWLMSPPCQPFTKGGKMLDHLDPRSTGLLYLIGILKDIQHAPKYVFLENVPNFESSECHARLIAVLQARGYRITEYMVSPCDPVVNIPNNRRRYYLAAKRVQEGHLAHDNHIFRSFDEADGRQPCDVPRRLIKDFIEEPENFSLFKVPEKYIIGYKNYRHDIVSPLDSSCTTFTKAYGSKHIIGTGSFLQTRSIGVLFANDDPEALLTLGLRFFTPKEIALLHGFPVGCGFEFPADASLIHQYRLLGNSLSIDVVSQILQRLLCS